MDISIVLCILHKHEFEHDPANLPLRNDTEYRNVASETLKSKTFNPNAQKQPPYGIAQYSTFYELKTIDFPHSFPIDTMHLVFENVVPSLFRWWHGSYLKENDDDDDDSDDASNEDNEVDALHIPKAT